MKKEWFELLDADEQVSEDMIWGIPILVGLFIIIFICLIYF